MKYVTVNRRHFLQGTTAIAFALASGKARALRRGGISSGGGGGTGFSPAAGVTYSGSFANGQNFTVNLSGGGLGARSNPLPNLYFPLTSNFSTDSVLSRNSYTFTGLPSGSNPTAQATFAPVNSAGSVEWTPLLGGTSSGFSTAFADEPYWSFNGLTYTFVKRMQRFSAQPANVKPWRVWDGPMTNSAYFGASGNEGFAGNDPTENTSGLTGGGRFNGNMPVDLNTWFTDETWFQQSTVNTVDGIWNWARQAIMVYDLVGRWQNGTTSFPGPYVNYFLDEYTTSPPNASTDKAYLGPVIFDDSWLQLIITDEGSTYQTMRWGNGGTASQREYQFQTGRTNSSINCVINQGSHVSLTGKSLIALTGYGTYIYLGVGT